MVIIAGQRGTVSTSKKGIKVTPKKKAVKITPKAKASKKR